MGRQALSNSNILAILLAGLITSGYAYAEKPDWAGRNKDGENNHSQKHARDEGYRGDERDQRHNDGNNISVSIHIGDRDRTVVHDYYQERYHAGHCPPGLAKKHNGCMPPGQAKKWRVGHPLPRDVIFYDLPPRLAVRLNAPPSGHRYVRVAADILLIAIGTGMVVDAIEDLGNM